MKSGFGRSRPGATRSRHRDAALVEPSGLVLNKQSLQSVREIAYEYPDVEFLYLRENEFENFDPYIKLEHLKMLDLSLNSIKRCDFLWGGDLKAAGFKQENLQLPALHHLYLTGNSIESLEGFTGLNLLETLALSSNSIKSFEGLGSLPQLRVLSLNFNEIDSFKHFPFLPCLHSLNLVGNPVDPDHKEDEEGHKNFRIMAVTIAGPQLAKVDGVPVTQEEREKADNFRGKVQFCMGEGFVPLPGATDEEVEDQAEDFLLRMQQAKASDEQPLRLLSIYLEPSRRTKKEHEVKGGYPGERPPTEGEPIRLNVCLQDTRPYEYRRQDIFHSHSLYPVAFKVTGNAKEVLVVGSMNQWTDQIKLERIEEPDTEVFFQTNLYLPPGTYEYRYIVDGVDKISDDRKTQSQYGKGQCNSYPVSTEGANEDDHEERETILHIRWLRNNKFNGFDLIPDENTLTYTPTVEDVGCCLRAEVLSYLNGDFSSIFYDLTVPVQPGEPTVTEMSVTGDCRAGGELVLQVTYSGGVEGPSEVVWLRERDGQEEDVTHLAQDVEHYNLTDDDVGSCIKVRYTPIRDDGVGYDEQGFEYALTHRGEPREARSNVVQAAVSA